MNTVKNAITEVLSQNLQNYKTAEQITDVVLQDTTDAQLNFDNTWGIILHDLENHLADYYPTKNAYAIANEAVIRAKNAYQSMII